MPDKSPDAFRTISEVAEWLGVQPHVLRFWESKFSQVKPVKRAGGRRYYRPNDMRLLGGIRKLLHEDGLTIKGAQKVLREEGMAYVAGLSQPVDDETGFDQTDEAVVEEAAAANAPDTVLEAEPEPVAARHEPEVVEEPQFEAPVVDAIAEENAVDDIAPARHADEETQVDAVEAPKRPLEPPADTMADPEPDPAPVDEDALADEDLLVNQAPAMDDAGAAPLPSFLSGARRAAPVEEDTEQQETAETALPSFMRAADPEPEPAQDTEVEPETVHAEAPVDAIVEHIAPEEPEPARARIIDAPDPDESALPAHPATLSAAFSLQDTSPQMVAELTPLIAQLAALRDRMAAERGR